jgi:Domain of unknown function (DUF4157)
MRARVPDGESGAERSRTAPARTAPAASGPAPDLAGLQRSVGNAAVARMVARAREEQREQQEEPGQAPQVQRSAVHEVLRGGGRPLPGQVRQEMEARMGADFSDVRLHSGPAAQRSAEEIGARAWTSGHHVVLGEGGADKHTLAHELTHVMQQRSGPVSGTDRGDGTRISDPSDRFEREAEANARRVMSRGVPSAGGAAGTDHAHGEEPGAVVSRSALPGARAGTAHSAGTAHAAGTRIQRMPKAVTKKGRGKGKKGETVADLLKAALQKRDWTAHGGARNLTMHYTVAADEPAEGTRTQDLTPAAAAKIYGGSVNTVAPKSFENARDKQSIRWISTLALNYLNDLNKSPEEVQVTLQDSVLYISSNKNGANDVLRRLADEKRTGTEFLKALIEANDSGSLDERQVRHKNKARSRLTEGKEMPQEYAGILAALTAKPVVPEAIEEDGKHAERRLADHVGRDAVRSGPTAGTKRPCVACYVDLYQGVEDVRPGPYWPSKAANVGFDDYSPAGVEDLADTIHQAVLAAGGTFASIQLLCPDHDDNVAEAMEVDGDVEMAGPEETPAAGGRRVSWGSNTSSDTSAGEEE